MRDKHILNKPKYKNHNCRVKTIENEITFYGLGSLENPNILNVHLTRTAHQVKGKNN